MHRREDIDILKGFGIFLMVLDHVYFTMGIHQYIQAFHMPLFFIMGGYLWKERPLSAEMPRRCRKLLLPYAAFGVFYILLNLIAGTAGFSLRRTRIPESDLLRALLLYPTDMNHMLAPAMWFLPCFFLTDICYTALGQLTRHLFQQDPEERKGFLFRAVVSLLFAVFGGWYASGDFPVLPLTLEPFFTGIFFWCLGEGLRKSDLPRKIFRTFQYRKWMFPVLFLAAGVLFFVNPCVDMRSARYHILPLYLLNGGLGTLCYWYMACRITSLERRKRDRRKNGRNAGRTNAGNPAVRYLAYLSRNSIPCICLNQFFINILKQKSFTGGGEILWRMLIFVIVLIVLYLVTPFLTRRGFEVMLKSVPWHARHRRT